MKMNPAAITILAVGISVLAQTPQSRVELQKEFPGWSVVESKDIRKPRNANAPTSSTPGWVQYPNSTFALLFKESGEHRLFKIIHKGTGFSKWVIVHQEDDQIDTAFCWIEPVSESKIKDAQGKSHAINSNESVLFSFDRGYEAVFTARGKKWERIITYAED